MPKTYLFYDLETTGRSKCFDQVLQFAAIRTDLALNELERHEIQIKLNRDVIPDPEAVLIHGIPMSAMQQGLAEIGAMEQIYALLNTKGTQSGGYNTLGFDDEFLRFSFYRNLLPAYNHQWANECGRFDLYPIAILYYLFKNEAITWPKLEGNPSLKLELLNAANQLAPGTAHNALVDVEATVALARLFARERDMWNYAMGYFDKQTDAQRIRQLSTWENANGQGHCLGLMLGECGAKEYYQFPVLSLGQHNHYKNQSLWLRLDKPELATTSQASIAQTSWVARKKMAEPGLLLPLIPRFTHHLTAERLQAMRDNLQWLYQNPRLFAEISEYHKEYTYPKIPELDPDAALYDNGFLTPQEQQLCQLFHQANAEKKVQLSAQFTNPTLRQLVWRVLGRHYPDYLTENLAKEFDDYLLSSNSMAVEKCRVDYRGKQRLMPKAALMVISTLREEKILNETQLNLLTELEKYILEIVPGFSSINA